jgi:hypothetical protein
MNGGKLMGDHCNVAFYESEQADLLQYQFMLYKRRGGDLWEVGPLLALSLLEVHEMFRRSTELIHISTAKIMDHHFDKLIQHGFRLPELPSEDIFIGGEEVDFFYAVYSDYHEVGKIDVYGTTTDNWEFPLPNRTRRFLDLKEREVQAELGQESSQVSDRVFGLRKLKSIDLLAILKKVPR